MKTYLIQQAYATHVCAQVYHRFWLKAKPSLKEGETILIYAKPMEVENEYDYCALRDVGFAEALHGEQPYPENAIIGIATVDKVENHKWLADEFYLKDGAYHEGIPHDDWWVYVKDAMLFEQPIYLDAPNGNEPFDFELDEIPATYVPALPALQAEGDALIVPCSEERFNAYASHKEKDVDIPFATPLIRFVTQIADSLFIEHADGYAFYCIDHGKFLPRYKRVRFTHGEKTLELDLEECSLGTESCRFFDGSLFDTSKPYVSVENLMCIQGYYYEQDELSLYWN